MPKIVPRKQKVSKHAKASLDPVPSTTILKTNDNVDDRMTFLNTFEKPSRIYSFLSRHKSPFMHRNLSYLPERKPARQQARKSFKINNLMNDLQKRKLYFILQFTGIFDKSLRSGMQTARVTVSLLKKLRHESESQQVKIGSVCVPVNPNKNFGLKEAPKLIVSDKSDANSSLLSLCFNATLSDKTVDYDTASSDSDAFVGTYKRKSRRSAYDNEKRLYGDLQLFDKKNRLIQMGRKLEASLLEINTTGSKKKMLRESTDYNQQPSVQFYIYRNEKDVSKNQKLADKKVLKAPSIIYQFHYNNNVRQHTKTDVGLRCLWCMLNCMSLNGLCMHLKLCHLRFLFSFTTNDKGAKIDVYPNQQFDGSYEGSPFDLLLQRSGPENCSRVPMKRVPITEILIYSKKVRKSNEIVTLCTPDNQRPFIDGHNRLYYHSATCLPIYPDGYDVDSENENDPPWLRERTKMMIDDFTDVNGGEKSIMKMWNLHLLRHKFVGDCYIPVLCTSFVQEYGKEIIERQLYRNFLVHLANLVDFGLLNDFYYNTLVVQLQRIVVSNQKNVSQLRVPYLAQKYYKCQFANHNNSNSFNDVNNDSVISVDDRMETSSSVMSCSPITRRKLPDQNRKRGT